MQEHEWGPRRVSRDVEELEVASWEVDCGLLLRSQRPAARRYRATASGENTARITSDQTTAPQT